MSLTEQVSKAQVKNILAKLKAGKTISRREEQLVAAYDAGRSPDITLEQASELTGLTRQGMLKVKRAMTKDGLPFNSEAILKFRADKLSAQVDPTSHSDAKLRKTLLEVEKLELQNAQVRGDLISRAEVRESGVRIGSTLSAEMMELVNDLPGMLAGLDEAGVRERLQPRVDLVLSGFRAKLESA